MLVFVSALQSPEVSKNWVKVSLLWEQTLRSICAQTCPEFRVVMVCNEKPKINFKDERLEIIEKKFSIPGATTAERMMDKWAKLKEGCIHARKFAPCHIMFVDADDLVSNRLAEFCRQRPKANGWVIRRGYLHEKGGSYLLLQDNFNRICGTSSILRCEPEDLPESGGQPIEKFPILNFGHTIVAQKMAERGTPLEELPFAGAVYNVGTGENDSGFSISGWVGKKVWIKKSMSRVRLNEKLREEFGIEAPR